MTTTTVQLDISALLKAETRPLVAFLTMLTGDLHVAEDLFQETCLEILRIQDRFEPGTDFGAWARSVARFQAMRHWRKDAKRKTVPFSPDVIDTLVAAWDDTPSPEEDRQTALNTCMQELEGPHREALQWRYRDRCRNLQIAERMGRTVDAVKMLMSRLRKKLRLCVEMKLNEAEIRRMEQEDR